MNRDIYHDISVVRSSYSTSSRVVQGLTVVIMTGQNVRKSDGFTLEYSETETKGHDTELHCAKG